MNTFKRIPIRYLGELHQVELINFSVKMEEVLPLVPGPLRIREFEGRALISLVNVQLKHMRPAFLPSFVHFSYRHVGFRLLIDDSNYTPDGLCRGIHFLRSFTDKPYIVTGGRLLTDYKLEPAQMQFHHHSFVLKQDRHALRYTLNEQAPTAEEIAWYSSIRLLDRAYAVHEEGVRKTQIMREEWPIEAVHCPTFETDFFKSARFESAFVVRKVIPYTWLSSELVTPSFQSPSVPLQTEWNGWQHS